MDDFWKDWGLSTDRGRQRWQFKGTEVPGDEELERAFAAFRFDKRKNPNASDLVLRSLWLDGKDLGERDGDTASAALRQGMEYYAALQLDDGHWSGDYGGPLFLLPGLVTASVVTETPLPAIHRKLIARYLFNHQNEDGGWGLHIEGRSTAFGTILNYVALRFLGHGPDHEGMRRALGWIREHGGATSVPPWGKFYLSLLNLYSWEGNHSLLPELWTLPRWLPFHPGRHWCHARLVYLPMSYCYAHRIQIPESGLVAAIREEIHLLPYAETDWRKSRDEVSERDVHRKPHPLLAALHFLSDAYERNPVKAWRGKALAFIREYLDAEDEQTGYVNLGPVNQVINSIAAWHAHGKDSAPFRKHHDRWFDYLWLAEDGMKMNGYNGSQLWDTAFATQAFCASRHAPDFSAAVRRAYGYIAETQIQDDGGDGERFFRHPSTGGWPFSTLDHSFPITDCTAEGLLASLAVHEAFPEMEPSIGAERMALAADLILSLQNRDGGWATYEPTRAPKWLEILNPTFIFSDIIVDHSYTECSASCIRALHRFRRRYPGHQPRQIERAIDRGVRFLLSQQREDGSWIGSWGVCFTYATWFALEALSTQGKTCHNSPEAKAACNFLVSKQKDDGGWGESYESCVERRYIQHERSNAVNTAWAALGLMAAQSPDQEAIDRAIRLLIERQQKNGDWEQGSISGVFNANCMITYASYRSVFPIWALANYDGSSKSEIRNPKF